MSAKDDLKTELAEKLKVAAELNVQASVPEAMDNLAEAIAEPVDAYTQEQIIIGVAGVNISETPNETKVTKTQTSEQLVDFFQWHFF